MLHRILNKINMARQDCSINSSYMRQIHRLHHSRLFFVCTLPWPKHNVHPGRWVHPLAHRNLVYIGQRPPVINFAFRCELMAVRPRAMYHNIGIGPQDLMTRLLRTQNPNIGLNSSQNTWPPMQNPARQQVQLLKTGHFFSFLSMQ